MRSFNALLSVLAVIGPAPTRAIRYLGRVNPATKELTWSNTGLSFTFSGSSASITLDVTGSNSAELVVDGKSTFISDVKGPSISIAGGGANGTLHTVFFRKSSEPLFGSIYIGNVTVAGGNFGPDVPVAARKIEVIGDSITSGYGIGGTLPCTNTAALEIISETYSVLTAKALNADLSIVSWSGIGIIRNYDSGGVDTSPIMPERWTKYGANDASGSYPTPQSAAEAPDAVVINLGTNDFGHNTRPILKQSDYTAAIVKFVKQVQGAYKNATFFLVTSPMMNDGYPAGEAAKTTQTNGLKDAIAQLNGTAKAYLVDWPAQGSDLGCDYHPTPNTNTIGAKVLTEAISKALGW